MRSQSFFVLNTLTYCWGKSGKVLECGSRFGKLRPVLLINRFVRIKRPVVNVGGELALSHLEINLNPVTGILESPIHMKSNCGGLIIDDFGRQRISTG
ncbi:MAG: hypothetical protein GY743_23135 [Planctomycetaceae bacterium]|nr:hypothetical protein [Planctomycetaceae bacterium]